MKPFFYPCPKCGNSTRVTSINRRNPEEIRRYRKCSSCKYTFCTSQPHEVVAEAKPRLHGENIHNAKLNEGIVRRMRFLASTGWTHLDIATEFDVEQSTATAAINGRTWKHVTAINMTAQAEHNESTHPLFQ